MTQIPFGRRDFLGTALAFGSIGAAVGAQSNLSPDPADPAAIDRGVGNAPAAAGAATHKTATAAARYRFVNLNRILIGWDKAKKLLEDFKKEFDGRQDALGQRQKDLQKKKDELDTLRRGGESEETRKREREIATEVAQLQYDVEVLKKDRQEKRLRILLSEYQEIQEMAAKWASQNDVDFINVIQEEEPGDPDLMGRYERALVRQTLWYAKDLDVTDQILKLLQA